MLRRIRKFNLNIIFLFVAIISNFPIDCCEGKTQIERVTITAYSPVQSQTDSTPGITASHFKLNRSHHKKVIALSKNLSDKYNYGDKFYLVYEDKIIPVVFQDRMHKRFKNKVDLLMYDGAKEFGIKKGLLLKRKM